MRALAMLLWGLRAQGSGFIPSEGPVVIACNHISNWDPVFVGLACRREVHFLAKQELFDKPLLGRLITAYNALPVRRGALDRRALRLAAETLKSGKVLVMFPEGTRSRTGDLGEPKPGIGLIAASAKATIVPAHIWGSNALRKAAARKQPVRVAFGPALPPSGTVAEDGAAYRETARRVMEAIRALRRKGNGK